MILRQSSLLDRPYWVIYRIGLNKIRCIYKINVNKVGHRIDKPYFIKYPLLTTNAFDPAAAYSLGSATFPRRLNWDDD